MEWSFSFLEQLWLNLAGTTNLSVGAWWHLKWFYMGLLYWEALRCCLGTNMQERHCSWVTNTYTLLTHYALYIVWCTELEGITDATNTYMYMYKYTFTSAWCGPRPTQAANLDTHTTVEYAQCLSLIHISEPTRRYASSYAVFCLKMVPIILT